MKFKIIAGDFKGSTGEIVKKDYIKLKSRKVYGDEIESLEILTQANKVSVLGALGGAALLGGAGAIIGGQSQSTTFYMKLSSQEELVGTCKASQYQKLIAFQFNKSSKPSSNQNLAQGCLNLVGFLVLLLLLSTCFNAVMSDPEDSPQVTDLSPG